MARATRLASAGSSTGLFRCAGLMPVQCAHVIGRLLVGELEPVRSREHYDSFAGADDLAVDQLAERGESRRPCAGN